jgi:hypothetical protein
MPALYRPDLRGPTRQQHRHNAGNKDSLMLAIMPVQCGRGHQRNAKKRETRKKNAIAALARPSKAKLLWADNGYSNKAMGDDDSTTTTPHRQRVATAS